MSAARLYAEPARPVAAAARHVQRRTLSPGHGSELGPAMPRFPHSLAALPAMPTVQRNCAECASEEMEEAKVRRRPSTAGTLDEDEEEETRVQPSLEVGPAGDRYEHEADAVATTMLAAPVPAPLASRDDPSVRRKCEACEREDEGKVRARAADDSPGTRIAASDSQLTSGGRALSDSTRDFFEARTGRDLSAVRVHEGTEPQRLNASIAARAFTYGSHIWLGNGEQARPGFTMAHELVHVLQQTQPEPTADSGDAAAASARDAVPAPRRIQRVSAPGDLKAFWLPAGSTKSALKIHTAMHNAALNSLGKENPDIIREVPIPGATAGEIACGKVGFADLFEARTTVGLAEACNVPAGSGALPVTDLAPTGGAAKYHATMRGTKPFDHASKRRPIVVKGAIEKVSEAPPTIAMGDMKPGHNTKARSDGVGQLVNYQVGINKLIKTVNDHQSANGKPTWSGKTSKITHDLKIPSGWDPSTKDAAHMRKLMLRYKGVNYVPTKGRGAAQPKPIIGKWVMVKDKKNTGIWTYLLLPDQDSLNAAFGRKTEVAQIKTIGKLLQDKVISKLVRAPKQPKPLLVSHARSVRRAPLSTHSARLRVQRAPPKGPAAPAVKDPFVFAEWEKERYGTRDNPGNSFRGQFEKAFPDSEQKAIELKGGAAESIELLGQEYEKINRKAPLGAKEMIQHAAEIRRFQFWASKKAAIFGRLRAVFGRLFVRAAEITDKIRAKIKEKLKGFKFSQSGSGLKAVAMKVGAVLLKIVGGMVIRNTVKALRACIAKGFESTMSKLVEGTFVEDLEKKADEFEKILAQKKEEILGDVDAMIEKTFVPIKKKFDDIAADLTFIGELVGAVKAGINALRIAACVAGGVETLGISCVLALGDFVLSLFGLSPVEALAGKIMQSCEAKRAFAGVLAATDFIKTLPTTIAAYIVDTVRGVLPEWAKGLLCDPKDMKIEPINPNDIKCSDLEGPESEEDETGGGGGGGSPTPGTVPAKPGAPAGKPGGQKTAAGAEGTPDKGKAERGGGAKESKKEGKAPSKSTKAEKSGGVPITKAEKVPKDYKPTADVQYLFLIVDGAPSANAMKSVDKKKGKSFTVVAAVIAVGTKNYAVKEMDVRFYSIGEPTKEGLVPYTISYDDNIYIRELDFYIRKTPSGETRLYNHDPNLFKSNK